MSSRVTRSRTAAMCAFVFIAFASGCSTYSSVDTTFQHSKSHLEVSLPSGWLRFNPAKPSYMMTKNGLRLEWIAIGSAKVGEKLVGTERVFQATMLPHEIAELAIAVTKSRDQFKQLEVKRIDLVKVAGFDGYRVDATCLDASGVPIRARGYGVLIADHVFEFAYVGADPIYFDKYLPVFETLVASATVKSK